MKPLRRLGPDGQIEKLCRHCDLFKPETTHFHPFRTRTPVHPVVVDGVTLEGCYQSPCKVCDGQLSGERTRRNSATPLARARVMIRNAKQRAPCNLDVEWVAAKLALGVCEVTGLPLDLKAHATKRKGKGPWNAPSLDRIDPLGHYTEGNVQVVVAIYNYCKNEFSDARTIQFIKETAFNLIEAEKAERRRVREERKRRLFDGQMEMW